MKSHIQDLISAYTIQLEALECRYLNERNAGREENASYFWGQWCKLGCVICDLKGLLRKPV